MIDWGVHFISILYIRQIVGAGRFGGRGHDIFSSVLFRLVWLARRWDPLALDEAEVSWCWAYWASSPSLNMGNDFDGYEIGECTQIE